MTIQMQSKVLAQSEVVHDAEEGSVFLVDTFQLEEVISMTSDSETNIRNKAVDSVLFVSRMAVQQRNMTASSPTAAIVKAWMIQLKLMNSSIEHRII